MALNDDQLFLPGTGFVYVAAAGTAAPADMADPEASGYVNIGHTDIDDNISITRDGGDSETLGTWQNPVARERRDPVTFAVKMKLLQFSNETLELYFGGGDKSVAGKFGVPITAVPQERALFIRIVDGDREAPLWIEKTSIGSDDDVEADTEKFMGFPVRATVLGVTGHNLMEFFGDHLGVQGNEVQTVTITGTPTGGTFTLTYAGQTTAAIAYNAAAAAVKAALVALSNIGSADVAVTGGPGPGTPWVVTFQGNLADTDVAQMTANSAGLTGGTSPAVAVTTTTPGGN
jgi:hypothetical protein